MKSKKIFLTVSLLATISIIITSCSKDREELLYPDRVCANATLKGPKFAAVESIIQSECMSCHNTGGTSPDLTSGCDIVAEADGIYTECVVDKTMPESAPLSQSNQDIISTWYNAGHKYTD